MATKFQNPWAEGGEYYSNDFLSKKALSSPFNSSGKALDVPQIIILKEISFSYFNKEKVVLLDYENPYDVDVFYQENTSTSFKIDNYFLNVDFTPPIFVDTPLGFVTSNYFLYNILHEFSNAKTKFTNSLDFGFISSKVKTRVDAEITQLINNTKKGTDLRSSNFRPFDDLEKLFKTISKAIENFLNTESPPNIPENEQNKAPEVDLSKFTKLTSKVIFSFKENFIYKIENSNKNYIKLNGKQDIICTLHINGSLKTLTDYYNKIDNINLQMDDLIINFPSLNIFYENELIISINTITIYSGGAVRIDGFQLYGLAKSLEDTEFLVRGLLQILALKKEIRRTPIASLGIPSIINSTSLKASKINKFIQESLESSIQESIMTLLESSKTLIPGFDLKTFIGI